MASKHDTPFLLVSENPEQYFCVLSAQNQSVYSKEIGLRLLSMVKVIITCVMSRWRLSLTEIMVDYDTVMGPGRSLLTLLGKQEGGRGATSTQPTPRSVASIRTLMRKERCAWRRESA
jgi:hypothetical protein